MIEYVYVVISDVNTIFAVCSTTKIAEKVIENLNKEKLSYKRILRVEQYILRNREN